MGVGSDITKEKSTLIRMVNHEDKTFLYQIDEEVIKESVEENSDKTSIKEKLQELLRFNPYICETFYADEVVIVEGPSEELILRAYLEEVSTSKKDLFILNANSVNNIPFYQKILSKFNIKYHVIFDTDGNNPVSHEDYFRFDSGIQKSISDQFVKDRLNTIGLSMHIHSDNFEDAHKQETINEGFRYQFELDNKKNTADKPYKANMYWKEIIKPNIESKKVQNLPIIKYIRTILGENDN